ncbi:AN1-type zinc finger protein 1-like [Actinia tenebrosa]|uniref:AN1-type zinc finger protein 1-like n=1 Tax=Actinia tenebrosa TaxID=6105 RepID=A0A6P8IKA5_ACTTE|nr:AN1-type zinc finger protein 1-like [Actinia tenebrosa]
MAEFPQLGDQCQMASCKQLDFLPFTCSSCNGIFCKEHRSRLAHGCPKTEEEKSLEVDDTKLHKNVDDKHVCCFDGCKNRELFPVSCEHCKLNFCLGHRHQVDHQCTALPKVQVELSSDERLKQITGKEMSKVKKGRSGVKNEARAAKVALMKLKMNAVGDQSIPQSERVYFNIYLPQGHKEKTKAMYFSKCWTLGKVVDKIASTTRLKNENNITSKKKLRLFHSRTGEVFQTDCLLEDLVHDENLLVVSGSDVILEYVTNDCGMLPNAQDYKS